jgi:hypothetical protein
MNQVNKQLLESVTGAYQMITQELSKPQEDVVAISVCGSTRGAIENVLKLYLDSKGVETKTARNLDELIKNCISQNNSFHRFDFSPVNCKCDPMNSSTTYCLGEKNILSCYKLLSELKDFIFSDLKIAGN